MGSTIDTQSKATLDQIEAGGKSGRIGCTEQLFDCVSLTLRNFWKSFLNYLVFDRVVSLLASRQLPHPFFSDFTIPAEQLGAQSLSSFYCCHGRNEELLLLLLFFFFFRERESLEDCFLKKCYNHALKPLVDLQDHSRLFIRFHLT